MTRFWTTAVAAGALFALALPATASASCIGPLTAKQFEQRADVIFVGVALEGPTGTGVQRFQVDRYLKGTGPETAAVATGVVARSNGTSSTTSVSVDVRKGERWQIYARNGSESGMLETNLCDGSGKLAREGGGMPIPDRSVATAGGGEDRTKAILLAASVAGLVLFSLVLAFRRFRRPVSSPG